MSVNTKHSILSRWLLLTVFMTGCDDLLKTETNQAVNQETPAQAVFVSALGRIEPGGRIIRLSAPPAVEGSRLSQILVSEGDKVAVGQTIAVLDGQDRLRAAVTESERRAEVARRRAAQIRAGAKQGEIDAQRASVARLEAELQNAEKELARAVFNKNRRAPLIPEYAVLKRTEGELANAVKELERAELLIKTGDVALSELDSRRTNVNNFRRDIERLQAEIYSQINSRRFTVIIAGRELEKARATLESTAEVRPIDVKVAEAEVTTAEAALEQSRIQLVNTKIRALTPGTVLKIHTRPGESIGQNGILELGETDQMYVLAEVLEADINKVKIGQAVQAGMRSTGETLRGTVEDIGLMVNKRSTLDSDLSADVDVRVVEVRIRLMPEDSRRVTALTNLRVDVRIQTV